MVTSSAPPALTPLLGRAAESARLDAILRSDARLVTLLGPPGIGKTRLAIETHRVWQERGGRAAWVDLSTTERREELCARVAHELGLRLSWLGVGDMVEELGFAIDGQGETLLVLDEAERCLEAIEDVIPRWLSVAPNTRALITSRERLGVAGEAVLELGPLACDDGPPLETSAARLLLTHAGMQAPTDATDRAALDELVVALDGVPLAIELVAARLRVLAPEEIVKRFADGGLGALEGHRQRGGSPLRAALEASWSRLDGAEQAAFAKCAAFVGSFDAEAAEGVLGEGAIDLLQSLRDRSLVARHDRRHRLYSPVRAFAHERLDELGLRGATERAHVACFAALADQLCEQLRGPRAPAALRRLTAEIDQLRAAHARSGDDTARRKLALGITEVLVTRGPAQDALGLIDHDTVDPALRVARARALEVTGRVEEAVQTLARALDDLEDPVQRSRALCAQSVNELARGNVEAAQRLAQDAFTVAPPRELAQVEAVRQRAVVAHARGDLDAAAQGYEAARALAEDLDLPHRASQLRADIGSVRLQERRFDEAREHYEAAVAALDPEADPIALGLAEGNLAILAQELGELDRAAELNARGIERLRRIGHRLYVAHLSGYAGAVEHERGELQSAIDRYDEAMRGLRRIGDARLTAVVASLRAAAEATRGRSAAAEEAFDEARAALEKVADPGVRLAVELHRHQLAIGGPDDDAARAAAAAAIQAAHSDPAMERSDDARIALRLLAGRLGHGAITITISDHRLTLPDGECVDLSTRVILWRIVEALARARLDGESLDPFALITAGWPGETPTGESGLNRVKVALSTLRKLGLRSVLVRTQDGYSFDPSVPLNLD